MLRKISAILIPTLIAVAIIGYMLARVWDELLLALENAAISFLVVAVVICVIAWILRGSRYQYILRGLDITAGMGLCTASIFVSQTANLIVPARLGDLVRIFILKHEVGATYSRGLSSLVVERAFDIITVALLGAFALPFILNVPDWFYTLIVVPLAAGAIFLLLLLSVGRIQSRNRYVAMIVRLLDEVRQASLNLSALFALGVSSIVIWLFDVVVCAVIALMFQQQIPILVIVLAIVIGNLVKAVPVTPGGVGTYELSLALTFELSGVAPAIATLIAVIDHLVKNLVTLAGGVVSIYVFGDWAAGLMMQVFSRTLDKKELV
jgi:uncharacterized membrane protein YbhN (UPF0104 family)